jgi:hypothetical protein
MLLPPDRDEWEQLCPKAIKAQCTYEEGRHPRNEHPLEVGMRVYDVLYCGKYGCPWGVVTSVRVHENGIGVGVDTDDGGRCASSSRYWVPVPEGVGP